MDFSLYTTLPKGGFTYDKDKYLIEKFEIVEYEAN